MIRSIRARASRRNAGSASGLFNMMRNLRVGIASAAA
jgi:hypothetical protein